MLMQLLNSEDKQYFSQKSDSRSIEENQYYLCLWCFNLDASKHVPFFWVLTDGE